MFRQGDKVVHPSHGAGVIKEIRSSDRVNGFGEYYIIELFANRLTVMVPVKNAAAIGLRGANPTLVSQAMEVLGQQPHFLPSEFKARQKELTDKLRSGDTRLVAEVCRDLTFRSRYGQLTSTDARLLEQARNFVATELAAVQDCGPNEAFDQLSSLLSERLALWLSPETR